MAEHVAQERRIVRVAATDHPPESRVASNGDGSRLRAAIGADEGVALRDWVLRECPRTTIEIGLGYGIAALFICEGLLEIDDPAARHAAIDPQQATRFGDCGLQHLDEANLGAMVEFHREESQTALPRLLGEGRSFDLAFVDGNHRFDYVFLDLVYLGRLLRPGAVIFVDDYQLPAVTRAVSFFVENLDWKLEAASVEDERHHWAVVRTSRVPDTRTFDHYVEF